MSQVAAVDPPPAPPKGGASLLSSPGNLPPALPSAGAEDLERRPSFGLGFLSSLLNTIRGSGSQDAQFMLNSPTMANLAGVPAMPGLLPAEVVEEDAPDKDGLFCVRLTPVIDHSLLNTGLYFLPVIRRVEGGELIAVGRYTEKNKSAAHAAQGLLAPVVFKLKVVSRTHALFQVNAEGSWFLKDCKLSLGTFLNNVRLSQALQELTLWPLMDGDIVQLGLDYRGGAEEVYRSVKMRCEFNRSWLRKVHQFNLDIHQKMQLLGLGSDKELLECAICLLKLEPCQALFISPCSHLWHYKCIRPIIVKSYPQFYCPNCRSMCDLETDIEDE